MIRCEDVPVHPGFRPLSTLEGVEVDLRYATTRNFSARVLYEGLDCRWIRREAGEGLERAAAWLAAQRPGWRLVVLDALRPQRVQEAIWADAEGTPMQAYFAHPARGSIHSFGMAVDVTLRDELGVEIDMGSGYDEMTPASHPELHAEHLALGVLSEAQVRARGWLQAAMTRGGFRGIPNEWWHFDFGDRELVRQQFQRVY